jgi:hypothetical protein
MRCPLRASKGNPVKFGSDPVAVIGDEIRKMPLFANGEWEGADDRMIRESEDLPCLYIAGPLRGYEGKAVSGLRNTGAAP